MAFDFPASPANGQVFTSGGVSYIWNGQGWVQQGAPGSVDKSYVDTADALKVAKAGDTMSGPLVLPADPTLALQAAPKQYVDAVRTYAAPFDALAYNGMQINGSMEVSQEIGTATQVTNFKFICDGWSFGWLGSTNLFGTAAPVSWHPYTRNALVVGVTTAVPVLTSGDVAWIAHNIEGYRVSRLMWGTAQAMPITLAFWSSHTIPGTYTGTIRNLTPDRCYAFTYTQNVASTPEYKAITIPGCTDGTWNVTNGIGMYISFAIAAGVGAQMAPSANTWLTGGYLAGPGQVNGVNSTSNFSALADVVVLPGTQAPTAAQSPLIIRPYDQELVTCQRYYQKSYKSADNPGSAVGGSGFFTIISGLTPQAQLTYVPVLFSIPMRAAPTCLMYSPDTGASGKIRDGNAAADVTAGIASPMNTGFTFFTTTAAVNSVNIQAHWTADARL